MSWSGEGALSNQQSKVLLKRCDTVQQVILVYSGAANRLHNEICTTGFCILPSSVQPGSVPYHSCHLALPFSEVHTVCPYAGCARSHSGHSEPAQSPTLLPTHLLQQQGCCQWTAAHPRAPGWAMDRLLCIWLQDSARQLQCYPRLLLPNHSPVYSGGGERCKHCQPGVL